MLQIEPKIRILFVFKRMLKTVFRKNPCDFFRLKTPKNEGDDILHPQPKTAVKINPTHNS